jgi:hypothetical protein
MRSVALLCGGILLVASLAAAAADAQQTTTTTTTTTTTNKPAMDDASMIKSAMTAAPSSLAKNATVIAMGADHKARTLRKGTNGWTCMPDSPETPGPDPMCWDRNADSWVQAWMSHQNPTPGKTGLMYMLEGGTDASNTDPYAKQPTAGNHWVKTGPHLMIVGADKSFYDNYPKSADPDTSAPYVMWAGTPYEHLMAPVK